MAHKPIITTKNLGRFERVEIGVYQQGVLYKNGRWQHTLPAHQTISWSDMSTAGCILYLFDCRPHTINWRVDLPSKNRRDQFPIIIEFTYQVQDGKHLIDQNATDTEALIEQKLKPELRKVTRNFELSAYGEVEAALEEAIEDSDFFNKYGLSLAVETLEIMLDFSDDDLARISGKTLPKQVRRETSLPSQNALYPFEADVVFKYRVTQKGLFAKAVTDALEWLWQELLNSMRAVSAGYSVNQLQEAQLELREVLGGSRFSSDGVEIISAFVNLSLGEKAHRHAEELDQITRGTEIDALADERRVARLERMIAFFEKYLPPDMRTTALGVGAEEMSIREAIERLDKQQQEKLSMQMSMFQDLIKADALPEVAQEKAAEALMHALAGHALKDQPMLAADDKPRLVQKEESANDEAEETDKEVSGGKSDREEEIDPAADATQADKEL